MKVFELKRLLDTVPEDYDVCIGYWGESGYTWRIIDHTLDVVHDRETVIVKEI